MKKPKKSYRELKKMREEREDRIKKRDSRSDNNTRLIRGERNKARKSARAEEKPVKVERIEREEFIEVREDLVIGRNAVMEALKSDKTIEALYITNGSREGSINAIIGLAKDKKIVIKEVEKRALDSMVNGIVHQGVVAKITPYNYCEVSDILKRAERKGQDPFIIILDEIEDPHNLGSIIRTAETCGVHGIIIPKRRNVGVTPTVYKSSVGAVEHVRIAKVTNINKAIDELKEAGVWIYGADIEGKEYSHEVNFSGPCGIVIGSEGRGISKLTLKKCDKLVRIPMIGRINSLNASVAGGIMMYEVLKGRLNNK
ncbi:RNA methyltransferase, TrmH family, group 3 [Clostridium thermobutyricum]|uniref:RNA methyltransferase, TrmH family, group 3 n=2 Tax=Clostridium thermobutyricum TaxID=29372 RepID=N9WCQ4_9CLOT|nr:23S rRNA (guanosine(2251)-2'-O)-methyltransferase RlmB [Clostridium thermobutyricum]ENZ00791.1 RNA methyltransferase, TrmH family, group 3 [Clostridium thermobutyricum]